MSIVSRLSELPSSQSTGEHTPAPAPTSQWKIWTRGINKSGDWHCTHRFTDGTETYHYVHEDGSVYMKHRDGSATYAPTEGTYLPRKEREENSKVPAPTMDEIVEEFKAVNKEYREYQARPLKYWAGVCTTLQARRRPSDISWLFPICDCGDRYSVYDYDYPGYDDCEDYDYEIDVDDDMIYEAENYGRDSEDEEEESSDDDRRSPSPDDEYKPIDKQDDDKTTVRTTDGAHPSATEEAKVNIKQEIKEEIFDGPFIARLAVPGHEKEEPYTTSVPDAVPESSATGSGNVGKTPRRPEVGPSVETEGKRILRSHRSKPY